MALHSAYPSVYLDLHEVLKRVSSFAPSIIQGLGYTAAHAQILN